MGALLKRKGFASALAYAIANLSAALGLAASGLAPIAQAYPTFPAFPPTGSYAAQRKWISANTNLASAVGSISTNEAVFAVISVARGADALATIRLREEALSAAKAAKLGGRSSTAEVVMDCRSKTSSIRHTQVYPGNNLQGGPARDISPTNWIDDNNELDPQDFATIACSSRPRAEIAIGGPTLAPPVVSHAPPALTAGPHWVQVGAFADPSAAERAWRKVLLLEPISGGFTGRVVAAGGADGRPIHRALIGSFQTREEATRFCRHLASRGASCLVR